MSKSEAQLEKERKQKEHRQKILKQHGTGGSSPSKSSSKPPPKPKTFQDLFEARAQGFQIDFRFRNAPPRPPVGPTFVGNSLSAEILEQCRQYKPLNTVEVAYTWRLHSEPDLGVPMAPSAMNLKLYEKPDDSVQPKLHPDDQALLNWAGPMGDTAADELKMRQEHSRAAARAAAAGKGAILPTQPILKKTAAPSKKAFSRVLNEGMQTWMKKTTYLSNDYTRKVHDFKSLAQTKQELADDLQVKQVEMSKRRAPEAIAASFAADLPVQHPTKKALQPKNVYSVLPHAENWGRAYTHLVIDKEPALDKKHSVKSLSRAFVGEVEKRQANTRMSCQVFVPEQEEGDKYEAAQSFDLDVIPLKEEDAPPVHFCLWVDAATTTARYLPISSRVALSTSRPVRNPGVRIIKRRPLTEQEQTEVEERMAEVDVEMAEKHGVEKEDRGKSFIGGDGLNVDEPPAKKRAVAAKDDDDDGEGDFGDDSESSSDDEALFGGGTKTIVAEG